MTAPDVLTTEQAAELLLCTAQTIEAAARRRELPGLKFGREWVFPRAALLEVLNRRALADVKPDEAPAPAAPAAAPGRPTLVAVPPAPPARRGRRRIAPVLPAEVSGAPAQL